MSAAAVLTPAARVALDQAESIGSCLEGVIDLLTPDGTLEARQRSNVAMLIGFLLEHQTAAINALRAELYKGQMR
jgi:hypothetical protein